MKNVLLIIWIIITIPFIIIDDIYWHFKRKGKNFKRDTSNSIADDIIDEMLYP